MTKIETVFTAAEMITPELAAKLADLAAEYDAQVSLECGDKRLALDSLICILAMELYRGTPVTIYAEGSASAEAAEAIRALLTA